MGVRIVREEAKRWAKESCVVDKKEDGIKVVDVILSMDEIITRRVFKMMERRTSL